jgi:pimeloyl-ACP methyl ester carboxylesterase
MPTSIDRYVVRHRGVTINLIVPAPAIPRKAVILAYGLPGAPLTYSDSAVSKLARMGFIVALPQYIGTFDSYGKCTIENSVDTMLRTIELLEKGRASELYHLAPVRWKVRSISLIGGSFGGSVALVAGAKSGHVKNIVAMSPPTDYRSIVRGAEKGEEGMDEDRVIMGRAQPFTWRFSAKTWEKAMKGDIDLNAVDYVPQLKKKRVLLLHGTKDESVSIERSKSLYESMLPSKGKKLVTLKGRGHFGLSILHNPSVFKAVVKWLSGQG